MRRLRENEILEFLSINRNGFLWRELIGNHRWYTCLHGEVKRGETKIPRKTLDRHLKSLIKKRIVEKVPEPRKKGERGRQSTRYRIRPQLWHSWGCMVVRAPAKKIGSVPFFGRRITRSKGKKIEISIIKNGEIKQTIRKAETAFVRLFPEEKKKADAHKAYLDHMKRRDWLRKHHPYGFEKLLKLEHEKRGRATNEELMEIIEEELTQSK